jgi:hypothetical protein
MMAISSVARSHSFASLGLIGQIMPTNPAAAVHGPLHIVRRGKTPWVGKGKKGTARIVGARPYGDDHQDNWISLA